MVPIEKLFERQESRKAGHGPEINRQPIAALFDGSRDHVQQSTAEQRPRSQRYERQQNLFQVGFTDEERDAADERDRAHCYPAKQNPKKCSHRVLSWFLELSGKVCTPVISHL